MNLTTKEIEILKTNSLSLQNAQAIAIQLEKDPTVGGIFPNALADDFSVVSEEKFKKKYCWWWKLAKILLTLAKVFTGNRGDQVIEQLIKLGNHICK
ncbi:MAG: hypothetical protein ABF273_05500 [Wenyingzhuangia sp.]|uniref:hypothetical protein n=1 Tax=Wenyingzhuangia sp. TaxID=1964193 RepID=UPI003219373B